MDTREDGAGGEDARSPWARPDGSPDAPAATADASGAVPSGSPWTTPPSSPGPYSHPGPAPALSPIASEAPAAPASAAPAPLAGPVEPARLPVPAPPRFVPPPMPTGAPGYPWMPPPPPPSPGAWYPGVPLAAPPPVRSAPRAAAPVRVDAVEGTEFGVVYLGVQPTPSGPAIGSMVAGIASIVISFVAACFGFVGSSAGWGPAVAGAFTALTVFVGGGSIGLGVFGRRQIRRAAGAVTGKGMAVTGIVCGSIGAGLALLSLLASFLLTATAS